MKRSVFLISLMILVSGCAHKFTQVDFKYSNLAYMNLEDAIVDFGNTDPQGLILALSEAFEAKSYTVISRKKLDCYYVRTPGSEKCCDAAREIYQQEFDAYRENDFAGYKSIDRRSPYTSRGITQECKSFETVHHPDADSWFLEVEIPRGSYAANVADPAGSFFLFDDTGQQKTRSISERFSSRLFFWAWRNPETDKTTVYIEAKPVNEEVVACPGCTIGYMWWRQASGLEEYKLVQHYVSLLERLKRTESALGRINPGKPHPGL